MSKGAEFRQGWRVLLGCILGVAVGGPALFYLPIGVLMKPIEADLHISRTVLSGGLFLFTIVTAAIAPFLGGLVDKIGVRIPALLSFAGLVLVFCGFAVTLHSAFSFYVLSALCAVAGAGSTPLTFTRAINDWFVHARGLAIGLMLMGTGLTVAILPSALTYMISAHGWRSGYFGLAAAVLLILPIVAYALSLKPSEAAQYPGNTNAPVNRAAIAELYSLPFWILVASFLLLSVGLSGLIVHFVPMLTDAGLPPADAARLASLLGIAAIIGRLTVGWLLDRFFAPFIAVPIFLLAGVGCAVLATAGVAAAPLAAIAVGLGAGTEYQLMGYLTARYFPRHQYGRAYGWQFGAFAIGNGLSPLWIAAIHDRSGSYDAALLGSAVLMLVPSTLFLRLPKY